MIRRLAILSLCLSALAAWASESATIRLVTVQPQALVNGAVCLITAEVSGTPQSLTAKWLDHTVTFAPGDDGKWYALAGVAYDTKPGKYDLVLEATARDGQTSHLTRAVQVQSAKYKTSRLTVAKKYVTPDPETLQRIEAEKAIKKAAFAQTASSPEWRGNFTAPVTLEISESYGTARTFNGKLATVHYGTDFRAPMGTPVHAANSGRVVLARELYYEGNCIVLDHGLGFMTIYMHLSKFQVKEGDLVEKGQAMALSGGTGRVTGPHLHLAVRWNGDYLDPVKLFALTLPAHP